MVSKLFERVVPFYEVHTRAGPAWIPLIEVELIYGDGKRVAISMVFDTGAATTTLRADLAPYLGATTWTEGESIGVDTAGGPDEVAAYRFTAKLEVLGKVIECPVQLMQLPVNPYYQGLLGREAVFEHFGFGFWESSHELLVTANP